MKVAIAGAGLVGRLAAWAAMVCGHEVALYDRAAVPVVPRGFVYLHSRCELPLPPQTIYVKHLGRAEDYTTKVYGDDSGMTPSFGRFGGEVLGYSPEEALRFLLRVQDRALTANFSKWDDLRPLFDNYDRVVVTLPMPVLFPDDPPERWPGTYAFVETSKCKGSSWNICVYAGQLNIPWSRRGTMFGYDFTEYPLGSTAIIDLGAARVVKVMDRSSWVPPNSEKVLCVGRYATWNKEALADQAFKEVVAWLSA